MRVLDFSVLAELVKEEYQYFFLLEMQLSTTVRFTSNDIQIWYEGNKYTAREFVFSSINYAAALTADSADISIGDADSVVTAYLLNEDCRNKTAILSLGVMRGNIGTDVDWDAATRWASDEEWTVDSLKTSPAVTTLFRGFIGEWKIDEEEANIKIVNEFILWKKKPMRTCSKTCPWTFNAPPNTNLFTGLTNFSLGYDSLGKMESGLGEITMNAVTAAGNAWAYEQMDFEFGKIYTIVINLILNSGELPRISTGISTGDGGGIYDLVQTHLAAGVNRISFRYTVGDYFWMGNDVGEASSWEATIAIYKTTECSYIGAGTWCDQSYERCLALGNNANYGGMRFAPAMQEKQVWWGRIPE